jgi:hypothetical protein
MLKRHNTILLAISVLVLSQLMCGSQNKAVELNTNLTVITFVDANQNGTMDEGEERLPAVGFNLLVNAGLNNLTDTDLITKENGETTIRWYYESNESSSYHCPLMDITVTPPSDMVLTTPNPLEVEDWDCKSDPVPLEQYKTVYFGFVSAEAAAAEAVPTLMEAAIAPPTETPLPTPTEIITPEPVASLNAVVEADQLSCRYGPGGVYLYHYGLIKGNPLEVIGRAETADGTWLLVNFGGDRPCWVNAKYVQVEGEVPSLAQVYPENAALILFSHPNFPPVSDVEATRSGSQVYISWKGYELALGDRESAESPQYLVEAWTCQAGKIVFTSYGAFEESAVITDEAGCSEPSHGQVFIAHKDGYVGPVIIPWPAQ